MKELNAFIEEILTVDYSYFYKLMEIIVSVEETYVPSSGKSWRVQTDWSTAEFGLFISTELGQEYAKEFLNRYYPAVPSVRLLNCALTELLSLPSEQLKAHVNRLYALILRWADCGDSGVLSNNSLFYDAFQYTEGIRLNTFDEWIKDQGFITQNLPICNTKIYLRKKFYFTFFDFISSKIHAVNKLIIETNTVPDQTLAVVTQKIEIQQPEIFIKLDSRENLIKAVSEYINQADQDNLTALINGKSISKPIVVNCRQNTLGEIFYKFYENKSIQLVKPKVAEWICRYFQKNLGGQLQNLSYSTMLKHLSGLHLPAMKDKFR